MITSDINLVQVNVQNVVIGKGTYSYRVDLWDNVNGSYRARDVIIWCNVGSLSVLYQVLRKCPYKNLRGTAIARWQYIN